PSPGARWARLASRAGDESPGPLDTPTDGRGAPLEPHHGEDGPCRAARSDVRRLCPLLSVCGGDRCCASWCRLAPWWPCEGHPSPRILPVNQGFREFSM